MDFYWKKLMTKVTIESVEKAVKKFWEELPYKGSKSACSICKIERDIYGSLKHSEECKYYGAVDVDRLDGVDRPDIKLENGITISGKERTKIFVPYMPKTIFLKA